MSLAKRLGINTIIQLGGRFIGIGLSLVVIVILTRYFGLSDFGRYTTIVAYLNFFTVIADLGLYLVASREMAKRKPKDQEEIFNNSLGFRIASAALFMSLSVIVSLLLPYDEKIKGGILVFSFGMFFYILTQVVNTIFQVRLKAYWIAIAEVAGRALVLGFTWYIIQRNFGLLAVIWTSSAGFILTFLFSVIFGYRYIKIRPRFNLGIWKYLLIESLPIGIVIILVTLFFRSDAVLLSLLPLKHVIFGPAKGLGNTEAVGIYGPPYRILDALFLLPGIFLGLVLPIFSKFVVIDKEKAKRVLQLAFDVLLLTAMPLAFGLLALSSLIINVVAGANFNQSIVILQIMGFSLAIYYVSNAFYYTMIGIQKQKYLIVPYLAGFAFSILSNLVLITYLSYLGAAITSVMTQLIIFILGYILVRKHLKFNLKLTYLAPSLVAGIAVFLLVEGIYRFLPVNIFHLSLSGQFGYLVVLLGLAIVVYIGILYFLRAIPNEVIDSLKKTPKELKP